MLGDSKASSFTGWYDAEDSLIAKYRSFDTFIPVDQKAWIGGSSTVADTVGTPCVR